MDFEFLQIYQFLTYFIRWLYVSNNILNYILNALFYSLDNFFISLLSRNFKYFACLRNSLKIFLDNSKSLKLIISSITHKVL